MKKNNPFQQIDDYVKQHQLKNKLKQEKSVRIMKVIQLEIPFEQ